MAEWLTPERLMPRWPSPDTRNKISAANLPVSPLSRVTCLAYFFGFIFDAHPQSPAQPPALRRRAAANQRRASQPTATPITAPTMTASRFM